MRPFLSRHILFGAEEPNHKQPELICWLAFVVCLDQLQHLRFALFQNIFFQLEVIIQLAALDFRQNRGEDVHVHVERRFSFPEFWKKGNGRLKVLRTCIRVMLQIFEVADPRLFRDSFGLFLVFRELGICLKG